MRFADLTADITFAPIPSSTGFAPSLALPLRPSGPGWFDSSFELANGLEVHEAWPGDAPLDAWLDAYLRQAPGGFAASPLAGSVPLSLSAR